MIAHGTDVIVSVVIPTTGQRTSLGSVIAQARSSLTRAGLRHEVLIGLDRADAPREAMLAAADAVVALPGVGPSAARNAASKLAIGDIIAFLDDDILVQDDWGRQVGTLAPDGRLILWAGGIDLPAGGAGARRRPRRDAQEMGSKDFGPAARHLRPREYGAAGHTLMTRAAWQMSAGFNETFGSRCGYRRNEDVELYCRARWLGMETRWDPALQATHLFPKPLARSDSFEQGQADFAIDILYFPGRVLPKTLAYGTLSAPCIPSTLQARARGYIAEACAHATHSRRRRHAKTKE